MSFHRQYKKSAAFLAGIDDDWAKLIAQIGPCKHEPKAARELYEALVRAVAYQQLTAKTGDAIIGRLKALSRGSTFPRPADLATIKFDAMRACGFSAKKIETIQTIARGALMSIVPMRDQALCDG